MSEHTKEPWSINEWLQPDSSIAIGAIGTPLIARVISRDVSINEQKANASRIIACVNACAGIPTGMLIAAGQSAVIALRPIDEVIAERDELLAAAQSVIDRWDTPLWKDVPATAEYINRLREAVGKVTP